MSYAVCRCGNMVLIDVKKNGAVLPCPLCMLEEDEADLMRCRLCLRYLPSACFNQPNKCNMCYP